MPQADIVSMFNIESASKYDAQAMRFSWRPTFNEFALHILEPLPADATILCVGVGTGLELVPLAQAKVGWRFLALDPSNAMLDVCRQRARDAGVDDRCDFFNGYLEDLQEQPVFDAATCLLVSHFMTEPGARERFFRLIARHVRPGGIFINCDLASDQTSPRYAALEEIWMRGMRAGGATEEQTAKMKDTYRSLVTIRPPGEVEGMLEAAGFTEPTLFYQALLLHAWFATRSYAPMVKSMA